MSKVNDIKNHLASFENKNQIINYIQECLEYSYDDSIAEFRGVLSLDEYLEELRD